MSLFPNAAEVKLGIRRSKCMASNRRGCDGLNLLSLLRAKRTSLCVGSGKKIPSGDCPVALREHVGVRACGNDAWRCAAGEQQDKQITHGQPPFVNDKGSIYFLPKLGLTNAYERFEGVRK